jgi:hypothetical protein
VTGAEGTHRAFEATASGVPSRPWEEVAEGDRIPELRFPISLKTVLLNAVGTRDLMPYHYNRAFTQSRGIRDIFVNTAFTLALFGRCATDWAGPEADVRAVTLRMLDQLCPGDDALTEGRVARVWREEELGQGMVDLALRTRNRDGATSEATVTLAMPSDGRPVCARTLGPDFDLQPDPGMPESARERIGRRGKRRPGPYPVSEAQIGYWCEMVRDGNPLYADGPYARSGRHRGVIAPALSYNVWAFPRTTQFGVDHQHPDVDLPQQRAWPSAREDAGDDYFPPGTSHIVVQQAHVELGAPIRPGDVISMEWELGSCSALKRTKLGPGYFVVRLHRFYNQRDELVAKQQQTILRYGVAEGPQ